MRCTDNGIITFLLTSNRLSSLAANPSAHCDMFAGWRAGNIVMKAISDIASIIDANEFTRETGHRPIAVHARVGAGGGTGSNQTDQCGMLPPYLSRWLARKRTHTVGGSPGNGNGIHCMPLYRPRRRL